MTKFEKVPGTDGWYKVSNDGLFVGTIKKCYSGRSSAYWLAYDPDEVDGKARGGLRIGFPTRKEAAQTLVMRYAGHKFTYPIH